MVGILNKRAGDQLIKYFCPQNNKESSASVGFHGSKERVSHWYAKLPNLNHSHCSSEICRALKEATDSLQTDERAEAEQILKNFWMQTRSRRRGPGPRLAQSSMTAVSGCSQVHLLLLSILRDMDQISPWFSRWSTGFMQLPLCNDHNTED